MNDGKNPPEAGKMVEHALHYASRGWRVFRLTGYKTPFKGSHGFKDGTVDANVIERLWGEAPRANIGLATGFSEDGPNIIVLDADGPGGLAELKAAGEAHGGIPRTLVARTSKGWHFYFSAPRDGRTRIKKVTAKRNVSGEDGLDINADGAYVVLPPSVNARTGFTYCWANSEPIAVMPAWLVAFCQAKALARRKGPAPCRDGDQPRGQATLASPLDPGSRGTLLPSPPSAGKPGGRLADRALAALRAGELPDFLGALRQINGVYSYDEWFKLGAAIYDFDPTNSGLAIFKAFGRRTAEGQRAEADLLACEAKWREYGRQREPGAPAITKATVYALARREAGEAAARIGGAQASGAAGDGGQINGAHALPAIFSPADGGQGGQGGQAKQIIFPDVDKNGDPRGTTTNAGLALDGLSVNCRKDLFHEKLIVEGHAIDAWAGSLSDDGVLMLRQLIKAEYAFDPGERNMRDAAVQRCLAHQFNPVVDYLDSLAWDGAKRIGRWVVDYLGAPDTPLNKEFGRLMLIAAVRRARKPGTKFDQIIVWEGKEGTNKSTALKILAGSENFSDQNILSVGDREQQEAMTGVWLYEIAELAGLRRADIERVKQFASRTEDRARPAYGRLRVDRLRQCVFVGTTNKDIYLQSDTGNRRFWPIATGRIDVDRLRADRDQLWAESSSREKLGDSIDLDPRYWNAAAEQQEERLEGDPWREPVEMYLRTLKCPDIGIFDVLDLGLSLDKSQINQFAQTRVARVLRELGWERFLKRTERSYKWRYRKKSGNTGNSGNENNVAIP